MIETSFNFTDMTAEFPLVKYAKAFAARLREGGWYVKDVEQKGRKVTWKVDLPDGYDLTPGQHFAEMLGTVGYYGSTQNRKAKLNGIPAPMVY